MERALRILLLEDSAEDAELLEHELRQGGLKFEIRRAVDRERFIAEITTFEPDVVLLDYALPGMNGLEGLHLLRQRRPEVPAIFVSGSIGEERAIECLKCGATDYIVKDRMAGLAHSIRRALREAEQREEFRGLEAQFRQSQKIDAIGRLAGGIAHDFNNMLTGIIGFNELALRETKPASPIYEHLVEIRKASRSAAELTDQLLQFSRLKSPVAEVLDPGLVVREACALLQRTTGRNYRISLSIAHNLGSISVNRGQLEQVLLNLVVNARDAMPAGGPIRIALSNVLVESSESRARPDVSPGRYVSLTVADEGCGMDKRVLDRIFEPFFTTKPVGRGTGLGLSTVYGIVRQGGGHLAVQTELGKGSVFKISFPRVTEGRVPEAVPPPAATMTRGGETILVVDDEKEVRRLMCLILAGEGYEVLEAESGMMALKICTAFAGRIHLLLSDVIMPSMDGIELARRFGEMFPASRILLVSGCADLNSPGSAPKGNRLPLFKKPFAVDDFLKRVRQELDADLPAREAAGATGSSSRPAPRDDPNGRSGSDENDRGMRAG